MLPLRLTAEQYKVYRRTLTESCEIKVTVQILTNDHGLVMTLPDHALLDGQVDGEAVTRDGSNIGVSRRASLELLDAGYSLGLDSNSPSDGALYVDRMIRIIYSVHCPAPLGWVDCHVFTGPVTAVRRDRDVISVECQGKEYFGLGQAYRTVTYKSTKIDALKRLLTRSGATSKYWVLPNSKAKLSAPMAVTRESVPWALAFKIGESFGKWLYYDGFGVARMRSMTTKPVLTLREGDGGLLVDPPQIEYSTDELKNVALVRGGKPKGSKKQVSATAIAGSTHPLSPYRIGTSAYPKFLLQIEENEYIRTTKAAQTRANNLLKQHLAETVSATANTLPIPDLEPWDYVTITTANASVTVKVGKFSLPLKVGADMSIGYDRRVTTPRRRKGKA